MNLEVKRKRQRHGLSRSYIKHIYQAMMQRCYNPKSRSYADYGSRGIIVCERWRNSFVAFVTDMGPRPSPRHSIDRIDNDGDYCPENCRWATIAEQSRNTRRTRFLEFGGVRMCQADWAKQIGISPRTLRTRLNRCQLLGLSIGEALKKRQPTIPDWPAQAGETQ